MATKLRRYTGNNPDYAVTLVHGTFANNAPWINAESEFSRDISKDLGGSSIIVPFNWSGKNSHSARIEAAPQLAEHLMELYKKYPQSEQIIIAHSHGGNVVMYAIKYMIKPPFQFKVITLATPFLNVRLRNLDSLYPVLPVASMIFFVPMLFMLPTSLSLLFFNYLFSFFSLKYYSYAIIISLISSFLGLFLFTIPAIKWLYNYSKNYRLIVQKKGEDVMKRININGYSSYKMMSVIYQGDEARAWLSASTSLNRFSVGIYKLFTIATSFIVAKGPGLIIYYVLLMFLAVIAQESFHYDVKMYFMTYSLKFFSLIIGIFAMLFYLVPVAYIISLISKSNPLVFGWESFYHILLVKLSVDTVPHHVESNLHIYKSEFSYFQKLAIKHSLIYSDENVTKDIANWVKKN